MQPFTAEFSQKNLKPQTSPLRIGGAHYQVDLAAGAVIESTATRKQSLPLAQVMGGKNVFYFLTPLERGRLQVVPLGYDLRRQEWFDVPASAVRHFGGGNDVPIDWRDAALTFNSACFNCHVSQLSKNYDLASDTYHTQWSEPGINCETCHGPGAEHVQAARALAPGKTLTDPKLIVTGTFTSAQMNSLCASCHAKLLPVSAAFAPGDNYFDHFGLIALEDLDFYPDGRDLGENFSFTTWRLSPCVQNSTKLDCLHCHTSSGRPRFEAANSNQACLPCHERQVNEPAAHSHHRAGSEGAKCIACHMPTTEFARMRRTDHSMRPPMPAATSAFGSPNACNSCHTDHTPAWADDWVRQWVRRDYQAETLQRARWIAETRRGDWSALAPITDYLAATPRQEIWAASLLQLLRRCGQPEKWKAILPCLTDPSPLVRAAAVEACSDQLTPEIIPALLTAVRDPVRLVRVRAAAALAGAPLEVIGSTNQSSLERTTAELKTALLSWPDDPRAHYNLGNFHLERRETADAIREFETAVRLQPRSIPPLVNAALAYDAAGQKDQAEAKLRRALSLEPTNAVVNLNAGMLFGELGKLAEAESAFRTAFASDPKSAAAAYNLSVLLGDKSADEAIAWGRRAVALRPKEPKYVRTLAYYLCQKSSFAEAAEVLEKTLNLIPDFELYAFLGQVYERTGKLSRAKDTYRRGAAQPGFPEEIREQFSRRAAALAEADARQ